MEELRRRQDIDRVRNEMHDAEHFAERKVEQVALESRRSAQGYANHQAQAEEKAIAMEAKKATRREKWVPVS